jgi:DNA-binding GntR family transcriptional regulator
VSPLSLNVDRSSPVPLYHQVATAIEAAVEEGELAPGTRLENETDLAKRLGLSRPTLRRAMQELVDKGLIVRKRGIGTQVVGRNGFQRQLQLTSLFDDLALSGRRPTTRVLTHEVVAADDVVADKLGLEAGSEVVHLERVRSADGEPLAVLRNWLPAELGGSFDTDELEAAGLYGLFRRAGVHVRIASQRIGARGATAAEADHLQVEEGEALVTMERTTLDESGRPVEVGRHAYRADRYTFEVTVVSA